MSGICKKRGCGREKYEGHEHCIFHCSKLKFDRNKTIFFWDRFKQEYIKANNHGLLEDAEVSDVIFPSFDSHAFNFYYTNDLSEKCTFINCIFEYDFNLNNKNNRNKVIFDNCTFFGDIRFHISNEIQIVNSEFKKELSLGNNNWQKLNISNTKFIKDVRFSINEELNISDGTIFRGNFNLDGYKSLIFNFENSKCSKKFSVENTRKINIDNVEIKSDINFVDSNASINIKNNSFTSNVRIGNFINFVLSSVSFAKELKIEAEHFSKIVFNDVNLIDWEVDSGNHLELIKTNFSGSFLQKGQFQTIKIKNSKIDQDFELSNVKNFNAQKLIVNGITNLSGEYDEININQQSKLRNTNISTTEKLNINDVNIDGALNLSGEHYTNVDIEKSNITNELNINEVSQLKLKNIKSKPTVKLLSRQYDNVLISDVRFNDLEIHTVDNLEINESII